MDKILQKYIDYISDDKSQKTVQAYKKDIEQFLQYFKDKNIDLFTKIDIENYKDYLLYTCKLAISSINRKLIAIHEYFEYYGKTILIKQIKTQNQNFLENVLSPSDISELLYITKKKYDYRAYTLINTLKLTGMRISECLQLTIYDIDKNTINIIGKGNKRRNVFIPGKLNENWNEYMKHRFNNSTQLFTGQRGAITRSTAYRTVQKYGAMVGIDKEKLFPHNLRHSYCLMLAKKHIPIEDISALVGHVDINITKQYLRKTKEELLDIINDI
ncbi:tyrosine-type recombinase/integrase [Clostridium sp. MT-14]|uniref:tyrosine-type recombinase/integrase n=1 Tax=Clostridium sp. MT-14 TaxID=3348360 RepID=UPI0035F4C9F8